MITLMKPTLEILYVAALFALVLLNLNSLILVVLYFRTKDRSPQPRPPENWPAVTVQLPMLNERGLVERLLNAVCALDYPPDRLQIQVLDNSTDETRYLVRHLIGQIRLRGRAVDLIQRSDRPGFKAGALAEGLHSATGELIAVFDADFLPPRDWLKKTVGHFADPRLGCLQTRWGHRNWNTSWFTRAQALGLDGHFIVEQTARTRSGLFANFNGSAALWRRAAIQDAGGWQFDTLTEDFDLSFRAQLAGWRIDFLPDVAVPAELPAEVEAFEKQQYRWAKGRFQVARKVFPLLISADVPERVRMMAMLHLGLFTVHPLMLAVGLLILPIGLTNPQLFTMFPWMVVTALGPPLVYAAARSEHMPRLFDRLKVLPVLTMVWIGLSLSNTIAVLQALFSDEVGTFERTPKANGAASALKFTPMVLGELVLGAYTLFSAYVLANRLGWTAAPWLLMYSFSFFYLSGLNLVQRWQRRQSKTPALDAA